MVVLLPKGNEDFQEIGLVEVLCKAMLGVIDCLIWVEITKNDLIHGFRASRGTGTTPLEVKLLQ